MTGREPVGERLREDTGRSGATADERLTDHQLAELATGFALGELDEGELRQLYEYLRRGDDEGVRAARIAWQVLSTTVDLRASLGTQLQDTVRTRVSAVEEPGRDTGFLGGVLARLGIERPRLKSVRVPGLPQRRRFPWAILAIGLLIGVLSTVLALWHRGGDRLARVVAVRGAVTVEGRFVHPDEAVDGRPLILGGGSRLELRWQDAGATLVAVGPATIAVQDAGVSVLSGRAWIDADDDFTVGLPDGQARLVAGSAVAVEVLGARSLLGVASGLARLRSPTDEVQREVGPDHACAGASAPFAWVREARWQGDGAERRLDTLTEAPAWRLAFTLRFGDAGDRVTLSSEPGAQLTLTPVEAIVERGDESRRVALPGPPLRPRLVLIEALPDRGVQLRLDDLDPVALPFAAVPRILRLGGRASIAETRHHTGPAPAPAEG